MSEEDEDYQCLWQGTKRRQHGISTPAHEIVLGHAILLVRASIMTGKHGHRDKLSPWPESSPGALSTLMTTRWKEAAKRLGQWDGKKDDRVRSEPRNFEARKVCQVHLSRSKMADANGPRCTTLSVKLGVI